VTAAVGDAPELLDVHVEQLPRSFAHVADRDARRPVAVAQTRQAVPTQHVTDRGPRDLDHARQAVRALAQLMARDEDRLDRLGRQRAGDPTRPRAAIVESRGPQLAVPPAPLAGGLPAHARGLGRTRHRPPLDLHAIDQQLPAEHGQLRPTMHRESPLIDWSKTPQSDEHGLSPVNNVIVNHS